MNALEQIKDINNRMKERKELLGISETDILARIDVMFDEMDAGSIDPKDQIVVSMISFAAVVAALGGRLVVDFGDVQP